jgi:hypothetical protein
MILKRIAVGAVGLLVALYFGDYLRVRFRIAYPKSGDASGDAFGTVTTYYSTSLKSGKTEVFFDQPQTETCVNSLFPHFGDRPCWYASRNYVKSLD